MIYVVTQPGYKLRFALRRALAMQPTFLIDLGYATASVCSFFDSFLGQARRPRPVSTVVYVFFLKTDAYLSLVEKDSRPKIQIKRIIAKTVLNC